MLKNRWLGVVVALLLAVTTACSGSDDEKDASSSEGDASPSAGESADAEVDVPDVPDVVAEVNGEEISQESFAEAYQARAQQAAAQQAQGGEQPDEKQLTDEVVQSLVNEELLKQEAERREISPSDKQVEETLAGLAEQNGLPSADALVKALEDQGMDREEIDSQAAQQARFDLLVADEGGPVKASEKEIRALYQQIKAQQAAAAQGGEGQPAQQLPPLKQVRPQLEDQVESQKESQTARDLIDQLRKDADITVNV